MSLTPIKRAKSVCGDGAESSLSKAVVSKCADLKGVRFMQDYKYLTDQLQQNGSHEDIVTDLATIMRSGMLRRILAKASGNIDLKGHELPTSCIALRGLRGMFMRRVLASWEPDKFTEEHMNSLTQQDFLERICFGLKSTSGTKLPVDFLCLRYENLLEEYLSAIYIQCGRRLQTYDAADRKFGHYERDGNAVKYIGACAGNDSQQTIAIPLLETGDDWKIVDNHLQDAKLVSESQAMEVMLKIRFQKAGLDLGYIPFTILELPTEHVPVSVKNMEVSMSSSSGSTAGSSDSPAAAKSISKTRLSTKRPPQDGNGRVRAVPPSRKQR